VRNREPIDEAARDAACAGIRTNVKEHWKNALGLLALSGFDGVLFYTERDTYWLQVLLALFGLTASLLWACLNFPPRNFRYEEGSRIAVEHDMMAPWLGAILAVTLNLALALTLAGAWCYVIARYVAPVSVTSFASFGIFVLALTLFACTWRIYPKAMEAECSVMLECDHLLRETALSSKEHVQHITCPQCGEPYHIFEPGRTRGFCGQCYSHDRFVAQWWTAMFAFGILLSSFALRQLAYHLVQDTRLKVALWIILSVVSAKFWWPLVHWRRIAFGRGLLTKRKPRAAIQTGQTALEGSARDD
jgi:hypothetical protein